MSRVLAMEQHSHPCRRCAPGVWPGHCLGAAKRHTTSVVSTAWPAMPSERAGENLSAVVSHTANLESYESRWAVIGHRPIIGPAPVLSFVLPVELVMTPYSLILFKLPCNLRCARPTWSSMQAMTPMGGSMRNASWERALCLVRAGPAPRPAPDAQPTRTSAPLAQGADEAGQPSSMSLP